MKTDLVKGVIKGAKLFLVRNAPSILTGVAASGALLTTLSAVRDSFKAKDILDETDKEGRELIRPLILCYLPTIGLCVTTIGCIIFANGANMKRNAALATACTLSDSALKEFQEKAEEVVGKEKADEIREKAATDKLRKTVINDEDVTDTGYGDVLVKEPYTGQIIRTSRERIKEVKNNLNDDLVRTRGFISMNEWLDNLGYRITNYENDVRGWSYEHEGLIDISLYNWEDFNGKPALVIDYISTPSLYADGRRMG